MGRVGDGLAPGQGHAAHDHGAGGGGGQDDVAGVQCGGGAWLRVALKPGDVALQGETSQGGAPGGEQPCAHSLRRAPARGGEGRTGSPGRTHGEGANGERTPTGYIQPVDRRHRVEERGACGGVASERLHVTTDDR